MDIIAAVDAAYLAGLIDGEGHIAVNRTSTNKSAKGCRRGFAYRSSISVVMTDRATLDWAAATTGLGMVHPKPATKQNHRHAWTWQVWSTEAKMLASAILPYLKLKAPHARNLIAFQAAMRFPGTKGLTDAEWDAREAHRLTSLKLNQRGPVHVEA